MYTRDYICLLVSVIPLVFLGFYLTSYHIFLDWGNIYILSYSDFLNPSSFASGFIEVFTRFRHFDFRFIFVCLFNMYLWDQLFKRGNVPTPNCQDYPWREVGMTLTYLLTVHNLRSKEWQPHSNVHSFPRQSCWVHYYSILIYVVIFEYKSNYLCNYKRLPLYKHK